MRRRYFLQNLTPHMELLAQGITGMLTERASILLDGAGHMSCSRLAHRHFAGRYGPARDDRYIGRALQLAFIMDDAARPRRSVGRAQFRRPLAVAFRDQSR